jgi:6-pyruvoyltetrahydropterin/6-carboxytetrahydropterin synthase
MITTLYTKRCFSAAHRLPGYAGPCERLHGHTWKVEITVEGDVNPNTGMVMDFKELKGIIDQFDHTELNIHPELPNPTAENLAELILTNVFDSEPGLLSVRVRVWESENSYAEVSG